MFKFSSLVAAFCAKDKPKPALPTPALPTEDQIRARLESLTEHGRRYYYTVSLREGQTFEALETAFTAMNFDYNAPRHRIGDGYIGRVYRRDEEARTAMLLARRSIINSLRDHGFAVSIDIDNSNTKDRGLTIQPS